MPLLTLRAAVVLLAALGIAIVTGVLTYLATKDRNIPAAVLAGGSAGAGALLLFNTQLI